MNFRESTYGDCSARTLQWRGNELVDWVQGCIFRLGGETDHAEMHVPNRFDSIIGAPDERRFILYERLGTKALLISDSKQIRELGRSDYQADRFDFPICATSLPDGRQALLYCPDKYNRLEIEDLETGERLSERSSESPDFFHSRLQVSPDKKWLLSAGWFWHPIDALKVFAFDQVLKRPELLDSPPEFQIQDQDIEVQSAVFTPDSKILLVTAKEDDYEPVPEEERFHGLQAGQVALFCPDEREMIWKKDWSQIPGRVEVGGPWALCLHKYPRLFRWSDWSLVKEWPHLASGAQVSSIATRGSEPPAMCFDLENNRFAVSGSESVTVVEWSEEL